MSRFKKTFKKYLGYVHCAFIMISGLLEDKASQVLYMAKGPQNGNSYYEDCLVVSPTFIYLLF